MTNPIVTVNVSTIVAPTPSALQKKGAFISQGGTTLTLDSTSLLTQLSDLTAILKPAAAIASMTWLAGTVTVTTTAPHGITNAVVFPVIIAGATPSGYNGSYTATATGASTFTYPLVADPGLETVPGTYQLESSAELQQMANTFFAQGGTQGVYVLELGPGDGAAGVTALTTFQAANPSAFYAYLVPRYWDAVASFLTYLAGFEANTSKTYFYVTTTVSNYTSYTATMKDVFWEIEAPAVLTASPVAEFSAAASFYDLLNYSPSSTNKVTPFAYTYQYGVTAYPTKGNATTITAIQTANGNIVGTGAEGGISNSIIQWGTYADGNDVTYWYSVDWAQINVDLDVSNAVINGSNDPSNPLYYNQNGIDRLQAVAARTMSNGVTYGLVLGNVVQTAYDQNTFNALLDSGAFAGQTVVNAVPFAAYNSANPSDYKIGKYGGFTIVYTPSRGFKQIVFNLVVTQFVAA